MVDVTVGTTVVTVSPTEEVTTVDVSSGSTSVSAGAGIVYVNGFTRTRYLGSAFSGVSMATGRSLVHSEGISVNALVSIGLRVLDTSEYSLSTTIVVNDTLTILGPLADDDVVLLWD
jgi:hypothetical protein